MPVGDACVLFAALLDRTELLVDVELIGNLLLSPHEQVGGNGLLKVLDSHLIGNHLLVGEAH